MKSTIIILCSLLATFSATGQVMKRDTAKMRHFRIDDYWGPSIIPHANLEPLSLNITYTEYRGEEKGTATTVELSTTFKSVYTREEFKEFGIWNFPNIWH